MFTRRQWVGGLLCVLAVGAVRAQSKSDLEIAAGTAPQALREFVRQTGMQVLFEFDATTRRAPYAGGSSHRKPSP
jgi:hypothetical protein